MIASVPAAARAPTSGYKVDVGRGARVGRVSSEWFSRPAAERFLSLDALFAAVNARSEQSRTRTVESAAVRVEASRDDPEALALILPGDDAPIAPTHWSFGQLAALVGAPAAYLRQLPAALAGINLQYGLASHRPEQIKTLELLKERIELRAATGPDYGRIHDRELVSAGPADRRERHRRHPLEGSRRARLGDPHLRSHRAGQQGEHHPLCVRPRRVPARTDFQRR